MDHANKITITPPERVTDDESTLDDEYDVISLNAIGDPLYRRLCGVGRWDQLQAVYGLGDPLPREVRAALRREFRGY